jgi:hypothetical protein
MATEIGTIMKDGKTYSYTASDDYLDHGCAEWETDTEGKFPQPKPILEHDIDTVAKTYKITCSHCSGLLIDVPLSGG